MRGLLVVVAALALTLAVTAAPSAGRTTPSPLHGVRSSEAARFAKETFACRDGSAVLPIARLNDDFCDCADGSDEPGTSACANGQFYCANKGARGRVLPSALVNDGVCDCCDGSDEYRSSAACANVCEAEGAAWRAEQAERIRVAEEGARKKKEYLEKGRAMAAEREGKLAALRSQHAAAKARLDAADAALKVAEESEKVEREAKRQAAVGKPELPELGLAALSAEELRSILVHVARKANAQEHLVAALQDRAEAKARDAGDANPAAAREAIRWVEEAAESVDAWKSEAAEAARREVTEARQEEARTQKDVQAEEKAQEVDDGPNHEFAALRGRCIDLHTAQYRYSVCPFDSAKQDHTSLGTFRGWKTAEDGSRAMEFSGGAHCWQGPSRSLLVSFRCGVEERILSIDEPSKCTYTAVMETPAVCDERFALEAPLDLVREDL